MPHSQWITAGVNDPPSQSVQQFMPVLGAGQQPTWNTTEAMMYYLVPVAGRFRGLHVKQAGAPGAGRSNKYSLRINGANSAVTATVSDTNTEVINDWISASVSPGDLVSLGHEPINTPVQNNMQSWSTEFVPDNPNQFVIMTNNGNSTIGQTLNYLAVSGQSPSIAAEENVQNVVINSRGGIFGTIKTFHVKLSAACGGTATRTLSLRVNGVNQLTANFSGTTQVEAIVTGNVTINSGDLLSISTSGTNSPTLSYIYFGIVVEPAAVGDFLIMGTTNTAMRTAQGSQWDFLSTAGGNWATSSTVRNNQTFNWAPVWIGTGANVTVAPGFNLSRTFTVLPYTDGFYEALVTGIGVTQNVSNYFVKTFDYDQTLTLEMTNNSDNIPAARGSWAIQCRTFFPITGFGNGFGC